MWIYDDQNWPNFRWSAQTLACPLADVRHRQGRLLGRMDGLGFEIRGEASLYTLTTDLVKSSAIEGEKINEQDVRSSLARRLGLDVAGLTPPRRDVEGLVDMMLDATQNFSYPLTTARLFDWHGALFPTGRSGLHKIMVGQWRKTESDPMQVVSGSIGREKTHFQAPDAACLSREMKIFLTWFNRNDGFDPVIKAGIAHLWFVTLHPFEDGNGRIARAMSDLALARADGMAERFYSLSSAIEAERRDYYRQLERQQRGTTDITGWLLWFVNCLGRALSIAEKTLERTLFKFRFWAVLAQNVVNDRQRFVINRMFDDQFKGFINTSKYAKLAKCSRDTALRDLRQLRDRGLLIQNPGGGRSTSYRLPSQDEIL